jgi:hypothetical protein
MQTTRRVTLQLTCEELRDLYRALGDTIYGPVYGSSLAPGRSIVKELVTALWRIINESGVDLYD